MEDIYIFFMVERKSRGFQIRSFLWISNLVRRFFFLFFFNWWKKKLSLGKGSLCLNSTVPGVCSTPGAVREAPGDPVSSRCPECELDIINETVERTEYGKKTERGNREQWHNAKSWWNMTFEICVLTPGKTECVWSSQQEKRPRQCSFG